MVSDSGPSEQRIADGLQRACWYWTTRWPLVAGQAESPCTNCATADGGGVCFASQIARWLALDHLCSGVLLPA